MKVVAFGEIMLRLNPAGYGRFVQAEGFEATYAGAEANVAVSLANFGVDASYVTKVPAHEIGQAAINTLRRYGVNTDHILRGGDRLGLYFLEKGASQRGGKVIYDRAGSAIATAKREEFCWDEILRGADWFHLSGITPALSQDMAGAALDAVQAAKRLGLTVSMDLNYRAKLWSYDEARAVYVKLLPYVDYCKDPMLFEDRSVPFTENAARMIREFGIRAVAVTNRSVHSANDHTFGASIVTADGILVSRSYDIHIVDRVGGGDAFTAGWIYSILQGKNDQDALEFAVAASCLKHTMEGDFNLCTVAEVEALLATGGSARVQR